MSIETRMAIEQSRPMPQCSESGVSVRYETKVFSLWELIAPLEKRLFRAAYRITRNREDAEDATQDALLQAYLNFDDFQGRSAFGTWLMRIAINSSLIILRKRKNARTVSLDAESDSEESSVFQELKDHAPDAEEQYLHKEREATLRHAISALDPSLRSVVELGKLGERSMKDTAEAMGVSVAAAKARLFRARQTLRDSQKLPKLYKPRTSLQGVSIRARCQNRQQFQDEESVFS